jgi:hypothetical protein
MNCNNGRYFQRAGFPGDVGDFAALRSNATRWRIHSWISLERAAKFQSEARMEQLRQFRRFSMRALIDPRGLWWPWQVSHLNFAQTEAPSESEPIRHKNGQHE